MAKKMKNARQSTNICIELESPVIYNVDGRRGVVKGIKVVPNTLGGPLVAVLKVKMDEKFVSSAYVRAVASQFTLVKDESYKEFLMEQGNWNE